MHKKGRKWDFWQYDGSRRSIFKPHMVPNIVLFLEIVATKLAACNLAPVIFCPLLIWTEWEEANEFLSSGNNSRSFTYLFGSKGWITQPGNWIMYQHLMLVPLRGPSSVAEWRPARTADVPLCRRPVIHAEHPESGFDWKACSLICDKYSFLGLLHSIVVLLRINGNLCGQLQDAVDTWHLEDWGRFSISLCTLFFQIETEWWNNPIIKTYLRTHWVCFLSIPFFSQRNVPKDFLLKCGMPTGRSLSPFQQNIRCAQTCSDVIAGFQLTFSKLCRIWPEVMVSATADTSAGSQPVQSLGAAGIQQIQKGTKPTYFDKISLLI